MRYKQRQMHLARHAYNRNREKRLEGLIIEEGIATGPRIEAMTFCAGLYECKYAQLDCLKGKKGCYYENENIVRY